MVSKGRIPSAVASVFFFILLSLSQVAAAKHLPAERSSCQAVDLSPCRDFVTRSTKNPSGTCCLRFKSAVRSRCGCRFPTGGTFLTVEQAQSLGDACKLTSEALGRCFDVSRVMKSGAKFSKQTSTASTGTLQTEENGSGMTNSSMQSPKGISASSNHSLHTDSPCPDCSDGPIDPSSLTPLPPNSP